LRTELTKEKKQMSKKIIAVDFDGTLCQFAFPNIGDQTEDQKKLMNYLIELKEMGHKLIL
jgi:hydroxymethylpyrimidine pyrophosphatase-like HAD family hydrolase